MDLPDLGPWPRTPTEAEAVQDALRARLDLPGTARATAPDAARTTSTGPETPGGALPARSDAAPATIAGLDVSYEPGSERLAAAVVVLDAETLEVVAESVVEGRAAFPYIPGLLGFREVPALLDALRALPLTPDVLVCDGYGLAHPRRFGLACHVGVLTGLPTFGVAKTGFIGAHEPPGPERGARAPLVHEGDEVGAALRTRTGVRPVFVSIGHRIDLDTACALTLRLTPEYRLPETTRRADRLSRDALVD
ncbi:deoxyribonuclease V [Actinomadura flavalba]|uniref:deoxyribonuclease V n=1 Tax=Actinomadura flavalba TaxID=1120938 RepID=UPI00035EE8B8|nr:deoxyribonuclease V [Actinomadura flavalba]